MILDKLLLNELNYIGQSIIKDSKLENVPQNIFDMYTFWQEVNKGIKYGKMHSILLGNILFNFITHIDVRNRQTNSRIFEDIFSGLFNSVSTDIRRRKNPLVPKEVNFFDSLNYEKSTFSISDAMAKNKREKCDLLIQNYGISLKTLKGPVYNQDGNIINKDKNTELNVGSFNYIALLMNILPYSKLNELSDRKAGLGSGRQLRNHVFDLIKKLDKKEEFYKKLSVLFNYVYGDEDVYIVLKSHYVITIILLPSNSFVQAILSKYKYEEETFESIWYRWENNNLRLNWVNLLKYMDENKFNYYKISINLSNAISNNKYIDFINIMQKLIDKNIKSLLYNDIS